MDKFYLCFFIYYFSILLLIPICHTWCWASEMTSQISGGFSRNPHSIGEKCSLQQRLDKWIQFCWGLIPWLGAFMKMHFLLTTHKECAQCLDTGICGNNAYLFYIAKILKPGAQNSQTWAYGSLTVLTPFLIKMILQQGFTILLFNLYF